MFICFMGTGFLKVDNIFVIKFLSRVKEGIAMQHTLPARIIKAPLSTHGLSRSVSSYKSLCRYPVVLYNSSYRQFTTASQEELKQPYLVKPHLNYKSFAENAEVIEQNIKNRNIQGVDIHSIVKQYGSYAAILTEVNSLRARRNQLANTIKSTKGQEERALLVEEAKRIKETLHENESHLVDQEHSLLEHALLIPNNTHPNTPIGPEACARTIKTVGNPLIYPEISPFPLKSHVELVKAHDLVDFEAAAEVTGTSFYYLKKEAALLEFALIEYALSKAVARGWTPIITPDIVRQDVAAGCGFHPRANNASQTYIVSTSSQPSGSPLLCLAGTAEIPLAGIHTNKILDVSEMPVRLVGFGRAFRAEAGARGVETKGLYRVHQFSKVELFAVTEEEESDRMLEEILGLQEEIYEGLGICFRVLDMPTEELGASAYRKYDIEAWMPGRNSWGEISSASNCTDYQSRRLNIRYRSRKGSLDFAHTLNGTAMAVPRILIALLEMGQMEDGRIKVPQPLRRWLGNRDVIG